MDLITTWIMWIIVATTNPNADIVVVLDEFPEKEICAEVAQQVAPAAAKDIEVKKILGVESIVVACIPVEQIKDQDSVIRPGIEKKRTKGRVG